MHSDIKSFLLQRGMPTPVRLPFKIQKNPHLISCIMPTYNRDLFAKQAIKYFLRQAYPRKELLIADDGTEPLLVDKYPGIYYFRLHEKKSLGYKRNILLEKCRGEIIAHWDDDDWYHPSYLTKLSRLLISLEEKHTVVGLGEYLVYIAKNNSLKICRSRGIAGATFFYYKTLWSSCPFRDVQSAEDYFFLQDANPLQKMLRDAEMFIVIRHGDHTWSKVGNLDVTEHLSRLRPYSKNFRDIIAQSDWEFYRNLVINTSRKLNAYQRP